MTSFTQDLKRWQQRSFTPQDGTPIAGRLRLREVLLLLWRHPPLWATAIYRLSSWCHGNRILPYLQSAISERRCRPAA